MTCRHCRAEVGDVVLDLGSQPSAETFPSAASDSRDDPRHPLAMWLCARCGLAQLADDPGTVEEQTMVVEPLSMQQQTELTLDLAAEHGLLAPGARVAEYGSPHGHPLDDRLRARGVDPVDDGPADLVVDLYGLLHEPDQEVAIAERLARLGPDGALVLQLHPLESVVEVGQFVELRHGHFAYWSMPALEAALRARGWGVHRARTYPLDHGTVAAVVTRSPVPDPETRAVLARSTGITDPSVVGTLQDAADAAHDLRRWLEDERDAGRTVVGYGAAGRAVPMLVHAAVDATLLPAVADAAATKHGRRLPGTDVPIVAPGDLDGLRPDRVLLFLPHLLDEVRRALPSVEERGGRWVVLSPGPTLV